MKRNHIALVVLLLALWPFSLFAAPLDIKGVVVSKNDGSPLIGASIVVKGTSIGTATDTNGQFTIDASKGNELIVSYLGYETATVAATVGKTIQIALTEAHGQLTEVVVTALGISKEKKSLGYSVQEIRGQSITSVQQTNIVNSLAGKVAGVNVTNSQGSMGSSRIVIRGETSIAGNNQPLFIIDGIPVDNSQLTTSDASRDFPNAISDINSEDIESISVLKGPNAAALYGSRAANGVILIKTKTGRGTGPVRVEAYSKTTFESILQLPTYQNVYGQGSGGTFSYVDGRGGGINDGVDESWGPKMDGRLIPQFFSNGTPVPFVPHPNNVRDFFELGRTLSNGFLVKGSREGFDYRFSYNNTSIKGVLPNTDQRKNSFGVNTTFLLLPNLELTTRLDYINTLSDNLPGAFGRRSTSSMLQFAWFGRQVDINQLRSYRDDSGNLINWNNSYYSNLFFIAQENTVSQRRDRYIGGINLSYKFLKNFNANVRIGNDYYNDRRKIKVAFGTNGTPFGSYQEIGYTVNERNAELTLGYNNTLDNEISIDLLAGGNLLSSFYEENNQKAPRLAVSDVYTLNNSRDPLESSNYYSQQKKNSVYASGQVGYKKVAFLNVTARNDWSSTLPRSNNSYFYPSINGSAILSQLLNIESNTLSYLKVRGGWSKVGKDSAPYQLENTYNFNLPFGSYPLLTASNASLNANLKPETTTSEEVGLELGLLRNRIKLDVNFYNTDSKDQILNVDVSSSTGYSTQLMNAGRINNRGLEAQLGATLLKSSKGLGWDVDVNFATNRSRVIELDSDGLLTAYRIANDSRVQVLAAKGKPYGTLFGTAYARDSQGNIIVKSNGLPSTNSASQYFGSFQPDWIGGITNTFTYKNIKLSFLIDAKIGGSIYAGTVSTGIYTGVLEETLQGRDQEHGGLPYYYPGNNSSSKAVQLSSHSDKAPNNETVYHDGMIFNGVKADGSKNDIIVPAQTYWKSFRNITEASIYDASFVKFRELTVAYQLPQRWTSAVGIKAATLSFIGKNLWIIYKSVPHIDPETALSYGNGQGIESLQLPSTRQYGFSLNINF